MKRVKWKCNICGTVCDVNDLQTYFWRENLDGENGYECSVEYYCPECGDEDVEPFWGEDDEEET